MNHYSGAALERFLQALDNHNLSYRSSNGGYETQCANPSHEDRTPSMSVRQGREGVVFHCHVCGEEAKEDILAALGLTKADLFDQPPPERSGRPQVVDTYIYEGPDGEERYRRDRREPGKDGKTKDFVQYRMTGGQKVWGLGDVQRVPWRLPRVIEAVKDGRDLYWVEGEKCVKALEKIGQVATTAGGAQDWRPHMAEFFDGATKVTVIADNDEPGIKHARRVAAALRGRVGEVRVVRGVVDRPKADIVEHLAAGHTLDELVDVLHSVPTVGSAKVPHPVDGTAALNPEPEDISQADTGPRGDYDYPGVFGLPAGVKTPSNYRVRRDAVAVRRIVKDEETWTRLAFAPIVATAAYEDPDGEQSVELSWTDRGKTVSRIVPRDIAKRGRELVKHLGGAGLPAIEADARLLERWLAEFEAVNRELIPHRKLARWLGWQPDGTFLSSPDGETRLDVTYEEMRAPARAHGQAGTFEEWRTTIAGLREYPVPRVIVAASLAAPLLRPLGITSFTVDVSSRSTKGKTTALQCGLSAWANPSEQSDAMSNWRTTLYAIEKRLNLVRGIVTVFDETMAVSDPDLIDQVIYQLPMNHGKARSGGAFGSMLPWETILLSSGERPALSFTTAQGAAARILGTTLPPFGNDGEAAVATRDGVLSNYGHAGPRFVESIRKGLAQEGGRDRLLKLHQDLKATFKGSTAMTGRRAPMVAVLALAERLACKAGVLPYEPLPDETWNRLFTGDSPTDNRPEMAMDVVREHIAGHSWELYGMPSPEDRPPFRGWLGAIKHVDGETRIALLPQRLKGILDDAGYALDAVIDGWLDAGYLELRPSQRPKHLIPVRFDGRVAKCFSFTPKALTVPETSGEDA